MSTIQGKDKAMKLHFAKAMKNHQDCLDKASKKRNKALCNEAHCLLLVRQGKGYPAILSYCKKVYKDKVLPANKDKQKWIAGRAKIYHSIAQLHDTIVTAELRKQAKAVNDK